VLLATAAHPLEAAVADYIGKSIVEVRLLSGTTEVRNPELLEIVETRAGNPLAMIEVRESIAHLFGLGLYQDVQVDAELRGEGVVLTYTLVPALRIRRIDFAGAPALAEDELRRILIERYGPSPSPARAPQIVATLQTVYRDRGYPRAEIAVRTDPGRDPSKAAMVLVISPGQRARVGTVDVQGSPGEPVPALLESLDLRTGEPYDGVALDSRLARYAENLRGRGYYEARATQLPRYVDGDATVDLTLDVEPGSRVEITFKGDALSADDRNRLVPIAREHSVDEDILEDSKFGIERHFRERGYCTPRADYERAEADGLLQVAFTISRGPQCIVERVDVSGNASLPSAELEPLVLTRNGQSFRESTVGSDVARLQGYYRQRGFSAVKVSSQVEQRTPAAGSTLIHVRLTIAEGVRSLIDSVSLQGNTALSSEVLRSVVTSAPGQPYFEPQITADADRIALQFLNRGYQAVAVRPVPKGLGDGSKVELTFVISEGPQTLIDHVLVVGNQRTSRETILREVQLKSGQPLSQEQEDETRTRLTSLGLFRRVDISYLQLPGEQSRRDVVITVDEAPVTTIGYGGGFEGGKRLVRSTETSDAVEEFQIAPRGFFEVSRRNLFGKDRSLNLFTSVSFRSKSVSRQPVPPGQPAADDGYGFNEYIARVTYGERRVLGSDADITVSAGVEQGVRSSFDFNRRGATASLARRLSRTWAISGRYGLDHTKLLNIKADFAAQPEVDRLFPQVRLSSVSSSVIRDTRDDLVDPTTGSLLGSDTELAARALGSEVGYIKTFFQAFTFYPLGGTNSTVLALAARLGLANGFSRQVEQDGVIIVVDDIPASERFYAGGDTTVRGFVYERLGTPETIDESGFPRGGHGVVVLNAELRIPVRGGLGGVVFLDGGNVFQKARDIRLGELRGSAGFGLRYRSPLGPIRVDLGFKLDRRPLPNGELERPTALHISLGQAF
jgi:outer membrane protein assembly complex protein YaeT